MNIDSIEVGGHTISFEIRSNEKGNKEIWAICDRTARILSVELNKHGKLVHSIEKGAKGTLFETKAILGGVATREEGPMNFEGKKVGTFEHHEIKDGFGRISTKNISKFPHASKRKNKRKNTRRGFLIRKSSRKTQTGSLSRNFGAEIGCREEKSSKKTHIVGF